MTTGEKAMFMYSTWNSRQTAKFSRETAANTRATAMHTAVTAKATMDIAMSNRQIVEQLDTSLRLQDESNRINRFIANVTIENNKELRQVNEQLDKIGHGLEAIRESTEKTVSAIESQTELHRKHYQGLEKQNVLREILYNMKKFMGKLTSDSDEMSKAYGARKLLVLINEGDFGTKDLTEIKDKEYFDEVYETCEKTWQELSLGKKQELEDLEKLYYLTKELEYFDPEPLAEKELPLKPYLEYKELDLKRPEKAEVSLPPIMQKYPMLQNAKNRLGSMLKKYEFAKTWSKLSIPVGIGVTIFGFIFFGIFHSNNKIYVDGKLQLTPKESSVEIYDSYYGRKPSNILKVLKYTDNILVDEKSFKWDNKVEKIQYQGKAAFIEPKMFKEDRDMGVGGIIGMIISIIGFLGAPIVFIIMMQKMVSLRLKLSKEFGISAFQTKSVLAQYMKENQAYEAQEVKAETKFKNDMVEYEKQVEQLNDQEAQDIKGKNKQIEKENEEIISKRKKLVEHHFAIVEEFKEKINEFLKKNEPIQQFLPLM